MATKCPGHLLPRLDEKTPDWSTRYNGHEPVLYKVILSLGLGITDSDCNKPRLKPLPVGNKHSECRLGEVDRPSWRCSVCRGHTCSLAKGGTALGHGSQSCWRRGRGAWAAASSRKRQPN